MLDHVRHIVKAAGYNRRGLLRPGTLAALGSAWVRNEVAFLRRTARLQRVLAPIASTNPDQDREGIGESGLGIEDADLEGYLRESRQVTEYCSGQLRRYSMVLPGLLNPNYGPVLYAAIRTLKPQVMVETGVGSGVSSTFFLSAMEKNGFGRLYSIDLPLPDQRLLPVERRTGWLVPDRLRGAWELTLGDARKELPTLLERLVSIDVFYHDSDHSYEHMMWEYGLAYPRIRPGGLLLSDDITSNSAWAEFTSRASDVSVRINRTGLMRKSARSPE